MPVLVSGMIVNITRRDFIRLWMKMEVRMEKAALHDERSAHTFFTTAINLQHKDHVTASASAMNP